MTAKLGVSRGLLEPVTSWEWPLHGLRHPPEAGTSGWYCWLGEYSDADDFFVPVHAAHLVARWPAIAEYLDRPPGSRFLVTPDYTDQWYDAALLEI